MRLKDDLWLKLHPIIHTKEMSQRLEVSLIPEWEFWRMENNAVLVDNPTIIALAILATTGSVALFTIFSSYP
jgi:hypothetical protein